VTVDPITLEVARNRLEAMADDMGIVLRRTAYSPNIKERADCSAALFDPAGEMLAQAEHIPVHLGSMPASVAAIIDRFGTDIEPGLQFAVNDPYAGGTHLNDLTNELVSHNGSLVHFFALVVWMQIGTADSRRAHPNDNVRGLRNPGIGRV